MGHIQKRTMMAGEGHELTAVLLGQNLSHLGVPHLSIQAPFADSDEYPDPVLFDPLDIRQVVGDGQQLLLYQEIGGILRADVGFAALLPVDVYVPGSLDHLSDRKLNPKKEPER